jgi:hypothetical protein
VQSAVDEPTPSAPPGDALTIPQSGKYCVRSTFPDMGSSSSGYSFCCLVRCLSNNRIRLGHLLGQHFALSNVFEPMLLAWKH